MNVPGSIEWTNPKPGKLKPGTHLSRRWLPSHKGTTKWENSAGDEFPFMVRWPYSKPKRYSPTGEAGRLAYGKREDARKPKKNPRRRRRR